MALAAGWRNDGGGRFGCESLNMQLRILKDKNAGRRDISHFPRMNSQVEQVVMTKCRMSYF